MQRITGFFRDLILRMARAFFIWGVIAGLVSTGFVFLTSRHAPIAAEWVLIGFATFIAALLGMVSALAWELTHIPHIIHLLRGQHGRAKEPVAVGADVPEPHADRR